MENNCEMPICSQVTDIQSIKADVKEIKNALLGSEFNKSGLLQRVEKTEIDIRSIKGRIIYFAGIGVGISVIIGFIIGKIWK